MANICCAWELGGGMGHVHALSILGSALEGAGHNVSYILQDKNAILHFLDLDEKTVFTAPHWVMQKDNKLPWPIVNYTEILIHRGYFKEEVLYELCRRWRNLLISNQVDLLIVDHAPTAILAAYTLGIKCISIGISFCSPQRTTPFPVFRDNIARSSERLLLEEENLLINVNKVLKKFNATPFENLKDLFVTLKKDLITTFPELDAYTQRTNGEYVGPILQNHSSSPDSTVWSNKYTKRFFIYLKKDFKYLEFLIGELSKIEVDMVLYIEGYDNNNANHENMYFSDTPINIDNIIKDVDGVVCHAGHGLVIESLLEGKPLVLIPLVMEQGLTSQRVEKMKAGIGITTNDFKEKIQSTLKDISDDKTYKNNAEIFSKKYKSYNRHDVLQKLVQRCEACI